MTVVDYTRSYILFTSRGRTNNARLMVEARCALTDERRSVTEEFFFFASCKSEHTYAPQNLFHDPNYDFCGIFSDRDFLIVRAPASYENDMNSVGPIESYFEGVRLMIRRDETAELLEWSRRPGGSR